MRAIIFAVLSILPLLGQGSASHYLSTGSPVPAWQKYTVTKIANGVSGCANANGCWQVNSGTPVNAAAGLIQDVTLFQLPANGFVHNARIKSATACTGTTTLTTTLGTTASDVFFISGLYDLKVAVSATNITNALLLKTGSDTAAATNIVAGLISTVENIDQAAAGCSFAIHAEWSVLP